MAAKAGTLFLSLAAFCLPVLANVAVAENPRLGVPGFGRDSHRGLAAAKSLMVPGMAGCLCDFRGRSRSTGKERDAETGLDYFGARYFSGAMGRFTSPDPSLDSGKIDDPQTWNRYAYVTNNPFRYVDPDGRERAEAIMDREMRAYLAGKMTLEQVNANQQARGVGAAIGALAIAAPEALAFGRAALTSLLGWGLSNPDKVQNATAAVADALSPPGTPGFASGQFMQVAESMSARAAQYQSKISGTLPDVAYVVNGVKFDGFVGGALREAKGPGYASFVKNGEFVPWFSGADALVKQAQRQVNAAGGAGVQWHFAERSAADATRRLLKERKISGIEVLYTPE